MPEFNLPDVGEGLTEAEIVSWRVSVGDTVQVNDVIVEIETAKSLVELPSPFAGEVTALLASEGETIEVGRPIIAIGEERQAMLVGYGPRAETSARRRRAPAVAASPPDEVTVSRPLAKPPVRKLAKDLGVDLAAIHAAGAIITRAEVEAAAGRHGERGAGATEGMTSGDGDVRIPVKGVRKATAEAMVRSAFTAPHVTEWVTLDVSRTMELVARLKADRAFAGVKVSPTLVVAKAICLALRRTPELNAQWDDEVREIVVKRSVNLGVAAATERGLVVPVIHGADAMSLLDLATAIGELTATAREGRTQPAQMSGGTFTLTNIGVFGVDGGTPIINPGESGILALGSIERRPWVDENDAVVARWVTTLALSFDHRVVDGEQGSRFLADVAAILRDPGLALTY
ncbi:MAG: catalytic protein of component of various dehydrogenase complexe [Aeromicrobium sp.]|nr:catalytic protein of component of various dehydrogenase complexe [Aeromicrobium sp.]